MADKLNNGSNLEQRANYIQLPDNSYMVQQGDINGNTKISGVLINGDDPEWENLQNSKDLDVSYDSYDANKMPTQITSSSASLGLSFRENITYNGDGTINSYNRTKL